ncbi:ABC transporter permease [bacterium]|nr:ABC transporter permease [bacterium]
MNRLKPLFRAQYLLIWVLLAMAVVFAVSAPAFCQTSNLIKILRSSGPLAVLVLGVTWIVASGEIDVSFPSVAGFTAVTLVVLVNRQMSWALAIPIAVSGGMLFGLLSGLLIVTFRCPSLIATIAVGSLARTVGCMILGSDKTIHLTTKPKLVRFLGSGELGAEALFIGIVVGIYIVFWYIQDKTTTGQHLYALGENRQAALEAGIRERRIVLSFFALSALLAAGGGVMWVTQFHRAKPLLGGGLFIDGLTAVFLGALIVKAGKPNVIGTLIGAVFLAVLLNGLTLVGIKGYVGAIIKGALMIFGVVIIAVSRYRLAHRARQPER